MHDEESRAVSDLETLQLFLDAENARDWSLWSSYLHPAVTYQAVGSENSVTGAAAYLRQMQSAYEELPDWYFVTRYIASTHDVVFVEFEGLGHYTGKHRSHTLVGAPLELLAVCIFQFKDGRIFRVREYLDRTGFDRQLDDFAARTFGI
jgi:predicted ester cyclase